MKYTIYQITNTVNNKIYIGKHQTKNLNDGYFGSGCALIEAIKKYGKENFTKKILFIFETEKEMNEKEKELITEEFVKRQDTYNLGVGGEGGPHFKGKKHTEESKKKFSQKGKRFTKSAEALENEKQLRIQRNGGSYFSAETIEKIKQKALERERLKRVGQGR